MVTRIRSLSRISRLDDCDAQSANQVFRSVALRCAAFVVVAASWLLSCLFQQLSGGGGGGGRHLPAAAPGHRRGAVTFDARPPHEGRQAGREAKNAAAPVVDQIFSSVGTRARESFASRARSQSRLGWFRAVAKLAAYSERTLIEEQSMAERSVEGRDQVVVARAAGTTA